MNEELKPEINNEGLSLPEGLMTVEQYEQGKPRQIPYVYTIRSGDREILFYGAKHLRNPDDPMFEDIENRMNEFQPDCVFVEGRTKLKNNEKRHLEALKKEDKRKIIRRWGEPEFTLKVAAEMGVERVESPEPDAKEEIDYLQQSGLNKDEIFAYYLYRMIQQYHHSTYACPIKEYVQPTLSRFQENTQWPGYDYSLEHLKQIGVRLWGEEKGSFEASDQSRFNPIPSEVAEGEWTPVNLVSQRSMLFRDKFIIQRIQEAMENSKRLFIVYGSSHTVMEEPALRKIFESKDD
jgi:hypothetical protein